MLHNDLRGKFQSNTVFSLYSYAWQLQSHLPTEIRHAKSVNVLKMANTKVVGFFFKGKLDVSHYWSLNCEKPWESL